MKKGTLLIAMLLITGIATAQYDFAVGLRSGGTSGITLKKNYEYSALEGIIGFWHDGISVTALWEKKTMAFDVNNLNWFYGLGGHVAVYGEDFNGKGGPSWYRHPHHYEDGDLGLGIDGMVGLEYKIPEIPFAFSFDFKPFMEITTDGAFLFFLDPGIGIKLAF